MSAGPAAAQPTKDPPKEAVVRLTVDPAPVPRPALKYLLLPHQFELRPGNGVIQVYKCQMNQPEFYYQKEQVEKRERYLTGPLDELPAKELLDYGGPGLRWADYAARHEHWDWAIADKIKQDGISTWLPDLQVLRDVARALTVRFRAEVKEGRYEDAAETAKTLFVLSHQVGRHPTLIGVLVGVAIGQTAVGPLEEMIARPGSPNLYWALTSLPSPFVDMRRAMQGERMFLDAEFPGLFTDTTPKSDAEMAKHVAKMRDPARWFQDEPKAMKLMTDWFERAKDEKYVAEARKRLIAAGVPEAHARQMPAVQASVLDEWKKFEVIRDDYLKWASLPYPQSEGKLPKLKGETALEVMLPAFSKVKGAVTRFDQRIALLMAVEAVRLYAAENTASCPRRWPTPRCRSPTTRSPASRSATR